MPNSHLFIFVLFSLFVCSQGCLLCPQRIPPRPKPLDQFRLPSIEKLLDTTSAIQELCNNESLPVTVSDECQRDVNHLFCSLNSLIKYFKTECPGKDDVDACSSCQIEMAKIYENNSWIFTWIDSIGKMPSGISDGNYHWLGDYEQCLQLKSDKIFDGHYCLVNFEVPDAVLNTACEETTELEVHLGICLPSSCTIEETTALIENVAKHKMHVSCEPSQSWSTSAIVFLIFSLIWLVIIIFMTAVVWNSRRTNHFYYRFAEAWSLQHNFRKCLRTTRKTHEFASVPGLQVVSLFLLVCGNVFFLIMPYLENVSFSYRISDSSLMQPIINYSLYADGLLALTALRIGLHSHRGGFKSTRNFLQHLFSRFFRVWPSYTYVTAFVALIYVRLGSGPMWSHNDLPQRCQNSWWANIMLINNWLGISKTCLDGGFLFALEAQLYVCALILLFFRHKHPKLADILIISSIIASIIYVFAITQIHKTYATLIPTATAFKEEGSIYELFVDKIYLNPFARSAPFLIGLAAPIWFQHKFEKWRQLLTPTAVVVGSIFVFVIIWTPHFIDGTNNFYLYSFYSAIHRSGWASAVVFVAFLFNSIDDENVFKEILGWKAFLPMSKLAFLVFLISEPVALSLFSSLHRPINATLFSIFLTSIGTFVCSYILAVVAEVFVALPIRHMFDIFVIRTESTSPPSEIEPLKTGK
uniref:Nose resistant-to-fluoxetine protein N-terminal domain-containing protein n=1 Tax=Panagrolaimus sp. JU765 TaxID=591449 RepID=A0AC34Q5X8_9BILA